MLDSLENAKRAVFELRELLKRGGFDTRKWASNNSSLVKCITSLGPKMKIIQSGNLMNVRAFLGVSFKYFQNFFGIYSLRRTS